MNRYFLATALLAGVAVTGFATEVRIESPDSALAKAGESMLSHRVPAEFVTGGEAGEWSFWYIASGDTPETMRLKPLIPGKVTNPKTGKEAFLLMPAVGTAAAYNFPYVNVMKGTFFIYPVAPESRKDVYGSGCAFAFEPKFPKPTKVFVEGRLRHTPACRVTVFLKKKDGACRVLTSTEKPHADENFIAEYGPAEKRVKQEVARLRLQEECVMESGDMLVFAMDKVDGKHNRWNPVAYLADPLKKAMKPLLSAAMEEAQ